MKRTYNAILNKDIFRAYNDVIYTRSFGRNYDPSIIGFAALTFAKQYKTRWIDLTKLEKIVVDLGDAATIYEWSRGIPGKNMQKLQEALILRKDIKYLKLFSKLPEANNKEILLIRLTPNRSPE